jgi:3-deoxy-7-phosphoheptulonate synthase
MPTSQLPAQWTPSSWRSLPLQQMPEYPDAASLAQTLHELSELPPLITSWEVVSLRQQLAQACRGERFVLQGGDCAEKFSDCTPQRITNKLKILLQMSLVLVYASGKPVVRVGRFAGQYAKPRSSDYETRGEIRLPSYRGDIINHPEFVPEARQADPQLLLRGYERAALTLNFVRALVKGGFADLHHPEYWDLDWARHSDQSDDYHKLVGTIRSSLEFMENILGMKAGDSDRIDFFTCHEALHLPYEESLTRRVPHRPGWFNLSTHFPWAGIRTNDPAGGHVEYLRGLENPVGVKVGSSTSRDQLIRLADKLNPRNEAGRLTFIHRFGCDTIEAGLPPMIEAVQSEGRQVLWICDPMHGNTKSTAAGLKTRSFEEIRCELDRAFDIHESCGSSLGGVHIELTGDNVTECTGGARGLNEADLHRAYESEVDPRLNYEQALEIAMLIAKKMSALRSR